MIRSESEIGKGIFYYIFRYIYNYNKLYIYYKKF